MISSQLIVMPGNSCIPPDTLHCDAKEREYILMGLSHRLAFTDTDNPAELILYFQESYNVLADAAVNQSMDRIMDYIVQASLLGSVIKYQQEKVM